MKSHVGRVAAAFALGFLAGGCGSDKQTNPGPSGGTAGASDGGTTASGGASGGSDTSGADQGGNAARGGESSSGGDVNGGRSSGGGTTSGGAATGGNASGGGKATGGSSSGGGGNTNGGAANGGAMTGGSGGSAPLPPALSWSRETKSGVIEEIWGSGANDIYAVGRTGTLLHSTGDGTWTRQNPDTSANLNGVWGSAANDVFVAVNSNVALHSTGDGTWEHQILGAGTVYSGVWGLDSENVYLVGPGVTRKTATGWESPPQSVTNGAPVYAIWGSSTSDLYAISAQSDGAVVFHSAGDGSWLPQTTPVVGTGNDIVGVDATHLYAAIDNNVSFSSGNGTWTTQLTTPTVQKVLALWVAGPNAIYACTQEGFFYRSNGQGTWSDGQDIDPAAATDCLGIWGTGTDEIYLGTSAGIFHGTPP